MPSVSPGVITGLRRVNTQWSNSIGQTGYYINNVTGASFKTGYGTPKGPWRPATAYRSYYTQVTLENYHFKDLTSGISWWGQTDHVNGVCGIPPGQDAYGTNGSAGDPRTPIVSSWIQNEVKTRAMMNLGNASSDLSADLVEVAQTIDLLANLLGRLIDSIAALRRGDYGKALKSLTHTYETYWKLVPRSARGPLFGNNGYRSSRFNERMEGFFPGAVRNGGRKLRLSTIYWHDRIGFSRTRGLEADRLWLEMQYGWFPLLSSIAGTLEWLGQEAPKKDLLVTGYASSTVADPPSGYSYLSFSGTSTMGAECKVIGRITNPELARAQGLGLTAFNLLTAAWEGVPLSFIIDWFLPIGNWLQAVSARQGLTYHDGYLGLKRSNDFVVTSQMFNWKAITKFPSMRVEGIIYQRVLLGGFPVPGLYLKSPFSSTHVLNAIALTHSTRTWR